MNLKSLFNSVESVDFATDFSVLSGFRIFQDALQDNEILQVFIGHLNRYPSQQNQVLDHVLSLAQKEADPNFQHPDDVALAAYLHILSKVNYALAYTAAESLAKMENLWWSKRIATSIVESMKTRQEFVFAKSSMTLHSVSTSMATTSTIFHSHEIDLREVQIFQGKAS